ncbi:MAG: hypothetical protein HY873_03370 [Chloroflexi bacterium]|nr:hypothetical protein [Chloroflexota bacterium]
MTEGELIVIGLRIAVPLLILRAPLAGGLAAMLLDAFDVVLVEVIGLGGFGSHYSELDKGLDTYYLSLELIVALGWASAWARIPALVLFADRVLGVVLFEATHARWLLLVFPNMFENWWLYCVVVQRFFPRLYPRSVGTVAIPMVLLLIPKLGQEWLLHYEKAQPWDGIKRNLLGTS